MYLTISLSIVLLHTCIKDTTGVCDAGWFGSSCQFKCRCVNNQCDVDGKCTGGSTCVRGWFGHLCQYGDLATVQTGTTVSNNTLTDGDDKTCASVKTFTVSWEIAYYVSWLRIVFDKPESLENVQVSFVKETGESIPCNRMEVVKFSLKATEILCQSNVLVKEVFIDLKSEKMVCSVHINGGRNVAIKQSTWQSTTETYHGVSYDPTRAVDGNTSRKFFTHKSCSHTLSGSPGVWKVTFSQPWYLNRYVIHNREDNRERIKGFVLKSNSSTDREEFSYTDQNPANDVAIYTITTRPSATPISYVTISARGILTLCEVETFSDHYCTPKSYGPECSIPCNCNDRTEKCFPTTGGCLSGCPVGFEGYGCSEACSDSHYGAGCAETCNRRCLNQQCNNIDGSCLGCSAGYLGVFCERACDTTYYGINCAQRCSTSCKNQQCSNVDGTCNSCIIGKQGAFCDKDCDSKTFGDHCSKVCSTNCTDQICDNVNGRCLSCPFGKMGFLCDHDCESGHFGQNCISTCSDTCLNSQCSAANGHCLKCNPGYHGFFCDKACDVGYYGDGCHTPCSSLCVVDDTQAWCNYTDGTCLLGCNGTFTEKDTECFFFNDTDVPVHSVAQDYASDLPNSSIYIIGAMLFIVGFLIMFTLFRPKKVMETKITVSEQPAANTNTNCNVGIYDMEVLVSELHNMQTDKSLFYLGEFTCYKKTQRFIGSQGPNEVGINDCARIIWEQNVDTSLILDITIKELKKDQPIHRCTLFHYTPCLDRDAPLTPWGLVDLEQRVALMNISRPIAVRYSARFYRNVNCFIALCHLSREAEYTGRINCRQVVAKLREDGILMMLTVMLTAVRISLEFNR
ncbi:uncharacterized protein LOC131942909 [Physella acuta]|uniref:uncharacterized protein LOC131942909 n=1 Tax=Physella acuta TaxID=109671 RepID=UPI0027DBC8C9|nr:uncharacterized protein LOC131942909 [Physella acuta]